MGGLIPKPPKPDPDVEAARKAEEARAKREREDSIRRSVATETSSRGATGRRSLLSGGAAGFPLRSMLGG